MQTNPLIARLSEQPVMIDRGGAEEFKACLEAVMTHPDSTKLLNETSHNDDGFWPEPTSWKAAYRPYIVIDGTLYIPIKGVMLNDFPWQMGNWATGYEYIWRCYERGLDDDGVRRIVLHVNSPGGIVQGNFDLVDRMFERRDEKPLMAVADEHAYSAAYNIFSVAPRGVVARTGGLGSIGIVVAHFDYSEMYKQIGLKITWIYESDGKTDGNSTEPLSERAEKNMKKRISALYNIFVSTVARNRGLGEDAVRALKSFTYMADEAVSEGLADEVGSLDDAVAAFVADLSTSEGDETMSNSDNTAVDQAAHEEAVATARTEGREEGLREGATAERNRINAIIACDEASDRPLAAMSAAMNTDMSVEDAAKFLATLPVETQSEEAETEAGNEAAETDNTTFNGAMENGNPEVGAEVTGGEAPSRAEAALALSGRKSKKDA